MKPKEFTYECRVDSSGGRTGWLSAQGLPPLEVSAPAEFKGRGDLWNPEQLLTAAVNTCFWLTLVGTAERQGVEIRGFRCRTVGHLKFADGGFRFTEFEIFPTIELADPEQEEQARQVVARAEQTCLITRSLNSEIRVEPVFASLPEEAVSPG